EPAVDQDGDATVHHRHDLGQHLERRWAVIHRTATVVRHDDAVHAVFNAERGIFSGDDAFHDQRNLHDAPDLIEIVPCVPEASSRETIARGSGGGCRGA